MLRNFEKIAAHLSYHQPQRGVGHTLESRKIYDAASSMASIEDNNYELLRSHAQYNVKLSILSVEQGEDILRRQKCY